MKHPTDLDCRQSFAVTGSSLSDSSGADVTLPPRRILESAECGSVGEKDTRAQVPGIETRRRTARCQGPAPGVEADGDAVVHGGGEERLESALGSTTNPATTTQLLLQLRRSAGCFTYPSQERSVSRPARWLHGIPGPDRGPQSRQEGMTGWHSRHSAEDSKCSSWRRSTSCTTSRTVSGADWWMIGVYSSPFATTT